MHRRELLLFAVILTIFTSCIPQRKLVYFQGGVPVPDTTNYRDFEMTISKNDFLTFQIFVDNPAGLPGLETSVDKQVIDNRSAYEKSIVVDKEGNIELPLIGKVNVAGLTLSAAKDTLITHFKIFLDNPVIVLKKLSFKISLLGEFNKPGLYYVPNEKLTFTEALGMGGDLTIFADRKDAKIYRKDGVGYREIKVDLTTPDMLAPDKMYVYPDDVIYIKATKRKSIATIGPSVAVIAQIISSTVLILTLLLKI